MLLINHTIHAIYFMIPKNFSTYILNILCDNSFVILNENIMKNNNETNSEEVSMYNYLKYNNKLLIHINHLFYIDHMNKKEKYKMFMFTRNPYKRFISGFLYSNRYNNNKYACVNDVLKNIIDLDIVTFFHTIVPQSFFLNYNKQLLEEIHIYDDEDIEKNKNDMLSAIGIESDKINKSYYKNESIYEKPFYEYYDEYTLEKINELFSDDFEMFHYKKIDSINLFKTYFTLFHISNTGP
jgi:hypothetical protein